MAEKSSESPTEKYLKNASPEEKRKFAEAFLSRKAIRKSDQPNAVPENVVRWSRRLSTIVVVAYLFSIGWSIGLLYNLVWVAIFCAGAWFPNETARATGVLGFRPAVTHGSNPWSLFVIIWLLFGIGFAFVAVSQLMAAF